MDTPNYSGKKILFSAFSVAPGSEAMAGYEFIKRHGADDITTLYWGGEEVRAKLPQDIKTIEVDGPDIDPVVTEGFDLVFRHQTTRPELIKSPSTSNAIEFFNFCQAPVIAVTGTKGKGTTTTLINNILLEAGLKPRLIGNIGTPAINEVDSINPDEIVCFEISSFQLWDLKQSPQVAVVLMIAEDHQDVHSSMEEYIEAKANITRFQSDDDIVFYHPTNQYSERIATTGKSKQIKYQSSEAADVRDGKVYYQDTEIMSVDQVGLIGAHNLENVCAAISAAWEFTQDTAAIQQAVSAFTGLEHRLQEIGVVNGVRYVNDSFAAATPAASAAINAFAEPVIALLGGFDKQVSFDDFARDIKKSSLKKAILMGDNRLKIADSLRKADVDKFEVTESKDINEIVQRANELAEEGDVVVLSPGSASFDMFENYKQRGYKFIEAVRGLSGE